MHSAVSTNSSIIQWIDLGNHTEACMTRPETCGAAGGAVSLWVRLRETLCIGIITTRQLPEATGINMFCSDFTKIV